MEKCKKCGEPIRTYVVHKPNNYKEKIAICDMEGCNTQYVIGKYHKPKYKKLIWE